MFALESDTYCNMDYIEVRQSGPGGSLIGRYCGSQLPTNVTVPGTLWVKFRSNEIGTAAGFMADFSIG